VLRNEEGRLLEFVTSPECRLWRVNYGALSTIERAFLAIWELDSQIYQDGLQLYLFNTSGRLAPRAPHALRAIGAMLIASILEKAIALVGKAEWHDETRRQETIEALSPETVAALERLERTFLAYPHDLMHLLYRYVCRNRGRVRAHPSAFRTSRRAQDERSKKKRKRDRTSWFALSLRNTSWPNGGDLPGDYPRSMADRHAQVTLAVLQRTSGRDDDGFFKRLSLFEVYVMVGCG
jgi:hypothetical protein